MPTIAHRPRLAAALATAALVVVATVLLTGSAGSASVAVDDLTQLVARTGVDAGGGEHVGGRVAAEVDRAGRAVDDEGRGLAGHLVGDPAGDGGGEDGRGDRQGRGAGRAGEQGGRGHGAPKVRRPGHTDMRLHSAVPVGTAPVRPVVHG